MVDSPAPPVATPPGSPAQPKSDWLTQLRSPFVAASDPAWARRLLFVALVAAFLVIPGDATSFSPGLPWDFRLAGPALVLGCLLALRGTVRVYVVVGLVALCVAKAAIAPATVHRGLVGYYYASSDFSGPVMQVRTDLSIDFTDGEVPLDFLNDEPLRMTIWPDPGRRPQPDASQMPFSVRWIGWIRGSSPRVATTDMAVLSPGGLTYQKGWGAPHLKLLGADGLFAQHYSDARLLLGDAARDVDDALTVLYLALLLPGLATVRIGWTGWLFLGLSLQAYLLALPYYGRSILLHLGDDWLTYETQARDVLQHGLLMNNGDAPFTGQPWYFQSFYAYLLAGLHALTGSGLAGIIFVQYLLFGALAVFAAGIAGDLWDRRTAVVAGLLAVAVGEIYVLPFDGRLLGEDFALPIFFASLWLLLRQLRTGSKTELIWAAALMGLAANLRTTIILFLPIPVIALLARRKAASAALFTAIVLPELGLVVLRNYLASGQPALVPLSGAVEWQRRLRGQPLSIPAVGRLIVTGLEYLVQWPWVSRLAAFQGVGLLALWASAPLSAIALRRGMLSWRVAFLYLLLLEQVGIAVAFGPEISYQFRGELLGIVVLGILSTVVIRKLPSPKAAIAVSGTLAVLVVGSRASRGVVQLFRTPAAVPSSAVAMMNDDVELLAAKLPSQVRSGQPMPIQVTWRALHRVHASYVASAKLLNPATSQEVYSDWFDDIGFGSGVALEDDAPTQTWRPGDVFAGTLRMRLPADVPPGPYTLELSLFSNGAENGEPKRVFEPGRADIPIQVG